MVSKMNDGGVAESRLTAALLSPKPCRSLHYQAPMQVPVGGQDIILLYQCQSLGCLGGQVERWMAMITVIDFYRAPYMF